MSALILAVSVLTACGGLKLGSRAADDIFRMAGRTSEEVVMRADNVSGYAKEYGVSEEALKRVAPEAHLQTVWTEAQSQIKTIYALATDEDEAGLAIGIGCQGLKAFYDDVKKRNEAITKAKLSSNALQASTVSLYNEIAAAKTGLSQDELAAAVWLCLGYDALP